MAASAATIPTTAVASGRSPSAIPQSTGTLAASSAVVGATTLMVPIARAR